MRSSTSLLSSAPPPPPLRPRKKTPPHLFTVLPAQAVHDARLARKALDHLHHLRKHIWDHNRLYQIIQNIISDHVVLYRMVSYHTSIILGYRIIRKCASYNINRCRAVSHDVTSRHIAQYHVISQLTSSTIVSQHINLLLLMITSRYGEISHHINQYHTM